MTPLEFDQALDRWGADLDRWPPDAAAAGRDRLAHDREARRRLQAALAVEAHLQSLKPHAAPAHLAARIAARAGERPPADGLERALGWLTDRFWRPALLAMLITTAGYLTGMAVEDPLDPELAENVMTLAFSDIYAELEDAQP